MTTPFRFYRWPTLLCAPICALICTAPLNAAATNTDVSAEQMQNCRNLATDADQLACYRKLTPASRIQADTIDNSQELADSRAVRQDILDHQELSYFTVSSGFRLKSDRGNSNFLYEAQIVKNISIHPSNDQPHTAMLWIDAPVRIAVRQLSEASLPVRTPSFNPGLRLTWAPHNRTYYSAGLHHYSNGQDGDSTLADGSINTRSGSFNTNYIELAAYHRDHSNKEALHWAQLSVKQHFYGTFEAFQRDQYPKQQVTLGLHSKDFAWFGTNWQFRFTETMGLGYHYVAKNEIDPGRNVRAQLRDRLNTRFEIVGTIPKIGNELGIYLRYDYGYDYYNINFQKRINRFQIGVAALSR
ncbi:MAG: hypothetical protein RL748_3302 [Pseudomonadota bacterium]|jgi:hypothetical protein